MQPPSVVTMDTSVLDSVPNHIKTPENLELKISTKHDQKSVGVFCIWPLASGTQFGPYVGKIVPASAAKGTDRRYSWEVFDLDTLKLMHVIDATNPEDGNWMRYVNCARYFEEQNIVSIQKGQDVFYKVIKDIEPGEELLTWYKPKRGRKRKSTTDSEGMRIWQNNLQSEKQEQNIKQEPVNVVVTPKPRKHTVEMPVKSPEKTKRIRKPKIIPDAYEGPLVVPKKPKLPDDIFEPLKPGQLRRRRRKKPLDSAASSDSAEIGENTDLNKALVPCLPDKAELTNLTDSAKSASPVEKCELNSPPSKIKKKRGRKKLKTEQEESLCKKEKRKRLPKDKLSSQTQSATSQLIEITNSVDWTFPEKGQEYIFQLKTHMIDHGPNGCVYTCDICHGIYKHKFSLKRHYLRNHINYRYLSKADIFNCLINLQQILETDGDIAQSMETENRGAKSSTESNESVSERDNYVSKSDIKSESDNSLENSDVTSDRDKDVCTTIIIENDKIMKVETDTCSKINSDSEASSDLTTKNGFTDSKLVLVNEQEKNKYKKISSEEELDNSDSGTVAGKENNETVLAKELDSSKIFNKDVDGDKETENGNCLINIQTEGNDAKSVKSKQLEVRNCVNDSERIIDSSVMKDLEQNNEQHNTAAGNSAASIDNTCVNSENAACKERDTAVVKHERKGIYRCYTCREIFDTLQEIREHTMGHSEKDSISMPYKCDKCSMRFFYKQNLVRHSASHEEKKPVPGKKEPVSPRSPALLRDKVIVPRYIIQKNHKCAICHQRFDNLEKLSKHQGQHKKDLAKKKFPCQYCGKDFLSITNMKKHVPFHLGFRITCRYCPEVLSNVGTLRKHTRISHPDIHKAKQLDKIARHGVLRRPDKKHWDSKEESEDKIVKEDKVKIEQKRKGSKAKIHEAQQIIKTEIKEVPEIKEEEFHFDHDISFAADEIDDGGSRFKFSCTVCKKRFSNYINMCRHRRKAHNNESKPKVEEPVLRLNPKKPQPVVETPDQVALFYASVSHNIATNLNEYIDGRPESLENFRDHLKVEDYIPVSIQTEKEDPVDLTWEMYNFPPNFKPGKTISFSEIRKEFDIQSEFDSHCKSFLSDSEGQCDDIDLLKKESNQKVSSDSDTLLPHPVSETFNDINGNAPSNNLDILNSITEKDKEKNVKNLKVKPVHLETVLNNTGKTDVCHAVEDSEVLANCQDNNSNMDLTARKANSLVRRQMETSQLNCASPCTLGFKHIENGEYANFDDLLIGDIESPIVPRSQSVCSSVSNGMLERLKTMTDCSSPNSVSKPLPSMKREVQGQNKFTGFELQRNPKPLSLLCENLLGLKRKEPVNNGQLSSVENSSLSSLDSQSSGNDSSHNGSILTTLSLAASQKGDERFQSTNQIFRDIETDYSETQNHSLDNYHNIAFGKNGQVACVCAICKKHFRDFEGLLKHHWRKHPASVCHFIEVEQGHEIDSLHFSEPSTVGALAVTDPGLENVFEREIFTCTRCGTSFKTLDKLHVHIVSCAPVDPVKDVVKEEKGSKTPIKKKLQKKIKNILNGGNSFKFKMKDFAGYDFEKGPEEPKSQNNVFTEINKKAPVILPESPSKLVRKKSQDSIGYNPQNHVRRRELTELVDSHQCEACGIKFKTIILLERHIPNCSKKEKFKDICPMKCPIIDESLEKLKHVCHYCGKNFTYLKSLVNHLQDFCAIKKQKVDKSVLSEKDKIKESEVMKKFKKHEEEKLMKEELKVVDVGSKRKGWQKGVKRKPKKKGHSWTVIKKRKPNSSMNEDEMESDANNPDEDEISNGSLNDEVIENESNSDTNHQASVLSNQQIVKETSDSANQPDKASQAELGNFCSDSESRSAADDVADDMKKIETIESIDEVDSGHELITQSEIKCLGQFTKENDGIGLNFETGSVSKASDDKKQLELSEKLLSSKNLFLKNALLADEILGKKVMAQQSDDLGTSNDDTEGEDAQMPPNTVDPSTESETNIHTQKLKEPVSESVNDMIPAPKELKVMVAKGGKTKSLLFQCIGSKVKVTESIDADGKLDTFDLAGAQEKKKDIAWQKFTNSLKKKFSRSKGEYKINNNKVKQSAFTFETTNSYKINEERQIEHNTTCLQNWNVELKSTNCRELKTHVPEPCSLEMKTDIDLSEKEENKMVFKENCEEVETIEPHLIIADKEVKVEFAITDSSKQFSVEDKSLSITEDAFANKINAAESITPYCNTETNTGTSSVPQHQVNDLQIKTKQALICHDGNSEMSKQTSADVSSNQVRVNDTNEIVLECEKKDFQVCDENKDFRRESDSFTKSETGASEQIKNEIAEFQHARNATKETDKTETVMKNSLTQSSNINDIPARIKLLSETEESRFPCSNSYNMHDTNKETAEQNSIVVVEVKEYKEARAVKENIGLIEEKPHDTKGSRVGGAEYEINIDDGSNQEIHGKSVINVEVEDQAGPGKFECSIDGSSNPDDSNNQEIISKCRVDIMVEKQDGRSEFKWCLAGDDDQEIICKVETDMKEVAGDQKFESNVDGGNDQVIAIQPETNEIVKIQPTNEKPEHAESEEFASDLDDGNDHVNSQARIVEKLSETNVIEEEQATVKQMSDEKSEHIETFEKHNDLSLDSLDTNTVTLECDGVYESVSEKVKKRKRNASSRQFSQTAFCQVIRSSESMRETVEGSKCKKNNSSTKSNKMDKSIGSKFSAKSLQKSPGLSLELLARGPQTNTGAKNKVIEKQKHSITNESSDLHNKGGMKSKKVKQTRKYKDTSRGNKNITSKKNDNNKDKEENIGSPPQFEEPYEIVLSPSERVKMNKRQCKKDTYYFGVSYAPHISKISTNIGKKTGENVLVDNESKKSKDRHKNNTDFADSKEINSDSWKIAENLEKLSCSGTSTITSTKSSECYGTNIDTSATADIQESKSEINFTRLASKESTGVKTNEIKCKVKKSLLKTASFDVVKKRGRPKRKKQF